jgi:hypothetical protein
MQSWVSIMVEDIERHGSRTAGVWAWQCSMQSWATCKRTWGFYLRLLQGQRGHPKDAHAKSHATHATTLIPPDAQYELMTSAVPHDATALRCLHGPGCKQVGVVGLLCSFLRRVIRLHRLTAALCSPRTPAAAAVDAAAEASDGCLLGVPPLLQDLVMLWGLVS